MFHCAVDTELVRTTFVSPTQQKHHTHAGHSEKKKTTKCVRACECELSAVSRSQSAFGCVCCFLCSRVSEPFVVNSPELLLPANVVDVDRCHQLCGGRSFSRYRHCGPVASGSNAASPSFCRCAIIVPAATAFWNEHHHLATIRRRWRFLCVGKEYIYVGRFIVRVRKPSSITRMCMCLCVYVIIYVRQ